MGSCAAHRLQGNSASVRTGRASLTRGLDAQGLADIAQYLLLEGAAGDGAHAPVAGWLWWALNPNSVDVGGLVWPSWHLSEHSGFI